MTPGIYRLNHDLPAPRPDRRQRHDWRAAPVKAGTLFAVRVSPRFREDPVLEIARLGGYTHHYITDEEADSAPFVAHLELVPPHETLPSMLLQFASSADIGDQILDILYQEGRITLEDVRMALRRWDP